MDLILKPVFWMRTSLDDLRKLPGVVQREVGFALHQVQEGMMPKNAKPLAGIGAGIFEIICDFNRNTYRAIYITKIHDAIYVLHVFQKKSKHGKGLPKEDVALIIKRAKMAKNRDSE